MLSFERKEKEIKELKIITKPNKTIYYENDKFDKTGMVVQAIYTDNTYEDITDYSINKNILSLSDTTVEIKYKNKTVSLSITVKENKKEENVKPDVTKPEINIPNDTPDNEKEYTFISGENQIIDKNNHNKLRFEINADSKLLSKILINGKQLSEKDYTVDKDKLIIEIDNDYLSSLNNPENTVEIVLTNDQVIKTKLFINEKNIDNPIIDDENKNENEEQITKKSFNKNWLYILLIIPIIYFIILFVKKKKEEKEEIE